MEHISLAKQQRAICQKYRSAYQPLTDNDKVALALTTLGQCPIYGTRILEDGYEITWFIYCGEHSQAEDFYQPVHVGHLKQLLPAVEKYLALAQGAHFIIDLDGYEDVWFDNSDGNTAIAIQEEMQSQ